MTARQLSDGNDDGQILGQSATDKVGFYGATPVTRQAATLSAAITTGATTGATNAALLEMYNALKALGLVS
jgi:hypothetical protein